MQAWVVAKAVNAARHDQTRLIVLAIATGLVASLAATAFREHAPGMPYAHPTVEHFTPLFVTLGAATDPTAPVTTAIDGYWLGMAKRSFEIA